MSVKVINYNMYAPRLATISFLRLQTVLKKLQVSKENVRFGADVSELYRKVRGFDIEEVRKNSGIVLAQRTYEQEST